MEPQQQELTSKSALLHLLNFFRHPFITLENVRTQQSIETIPLFVINILIFLLAAILTPFLQIRGMPVMLSYTVHTCIFSIVLILITTAGIVINGKLFRGEGNFRHIFAAVNIILFPLYISVLEMSIETTITGQIFPAFGVLPFSIYGFFSLCLLWWTMKHYHGIAGVKLFFAWILFVIPLTIYLAIATVFTALAG